MTLLQLHLEEGCVLQRRPEGASVSARLSGFAGAIPRVEVDAGDVSVHGLGPGEAELRLTNLPPGGPYSLRVTPANGLPFSRTFYVGDLWLLGGQSNMEGIGLMADAALPHPLIQSFSMARVWGQALEPLHFLAESPDEVHHMGFPLAPAEAAQAKAKAVKGSGVGLHFARLMLERSGVPQGLICVAHGGTTMAQWSPGQPLYTSMMASLRQVAQPIAGVLWYQGCSDTNKPHDAAAYTERTIRFVQTVREDLGQPELPWLVVQIGTEVGRTTGLEAWHSVQDQQRLLPSLVPHLDVCAAADLEHDDWIHVSGRAFPTLAKRLAVLADWLVFKRLGTLPAPRPLRVRFTPDELSPMLTVDCEHVEGSWSSTGLTLGFALRDAQGRDQPLIYQTRFEGSRIKIRLTDDDLAGVSLYHGTGAQPQINTYDERGMPLPVFGPLTIEGLPPLSPWIRDWRLSPLTPAKLNTLTPTFWQDSSGWTVRRIEGWNVVDLHEAWAAGAFCVAGQTTLEFKTARSFTLLAGGDGPLKVWMGEQLVVDDASDVRDLSVVRSSKKISVEAGSHTVTVAMNNRRGQAYGFYLRLRYEDL